jgi:hypothetical protein
MKTRGRVTVSLFVAALGAAALPRPAWSAPDWTWNEKVAAGGVVEIRNVNGAIAAEGAPGSDVQVTVQKKANDDNPQDLKIEVVRHAQGVTICAVYPPPPGEPANECKPGGGRMNIRRGFEVTANFSVKLPAGLRLLGRTVNGGITASGLGGDADLATVNGSVQGSAAGLVRAKSVNGSVTASMGRTDWRGDLEVETVNGSVTVELPPSAATEVEGSTVNGSIETDFGLEVRGKWGPKKTSGTIGGGGRQLELKTVNGSIQLRKRGAGRG